SGSYEIVEISPTFQIAYEIEDLCTFARAADKFKVHRYGDSICFQICLDFRTRASGNYFVRMFQPPTYGIIWVLRPLLSPEGGWNAHCTTSLAGWHPRSAG